MQGFSMNDPLAALLMQLTAEQRPALRYLERGWSPAALMEEAARLAAGLRDLGLAPGARIGLALPNLPAAAVALLACWQGGFVAQPVDPRRPVEALLDWQAALRPEALITLDLATVFERARPLFADPGLRWVVVARMADQLSRLKRLVAPWLRAGGTVRDWPDARFRAWPALLAAPRPAASSAAEAPALQLPNGEQLTRAAVAALLPGGDSETALLALPLAHHGALAALLGALARPAGPLLLSPRLDSRSLAKIAKATGVTHRIA